MENMENDNNFSEMLNSLLQNPKIGEIMSSIVSSNAQQAGEDGSESGVAPVESEAKNDAVPKDLLALLPKVMSGIRNTGMLAPKADQSEERANDPKKKSDSQRKALLFALKPYLSSRRRALIDGLIQLEGLTGVLNILNSNEKNGGS